MSSTFLWWYGNHFSTNNLTMSPLYGQNDVKEMVKWKVQFFFFFHIPFLILYPKSIWFMLKFISKQFSIPYIKLKGIGKKNEHLWPLQYFFQNTHRSISTHVTNAPLSIHWSIFTVSARIVPNTHCPLVTFVQQRWFLGGRRRTRFLRRQWMCFGGSFKFHSKHGPQVSTSSNGQSGSPHLTPKSIQFHFLSSIATSPQ